MQAAQTAVKEEVARLEAMSEAIIEDAAPFLARIASAQYFWRQQHELSRVDPARATAIQMDLWAADALRSDGPRYTLIIVDVVKLGAATNPCAVLLIPQGREHE